jgi:hypothetical protein
MAGPNAGRRGRRWRTIVANLRAQQRPCCRCGMTIDYSLRWPDRDCFTADHYPLPLSTHPHLAEDPSAIDAAHLRCNVGAGNREPAPGLGSTSRDW